jgi:ATP-dependent DNA helicase RecG
MMRMATNRSTDYLISLVNEPRQLPAQTDWVEFKHANGGPEAIGES